MRVLLEHARQVFVKPIVVFAQINDLLRQLPELDKLLSVEVGNLVQLPQGLPKAFAQIRELGTLLPNGLKRSVIPTQVPLGIGPPDTILTSVVFQSLAVKVAFALRSLGPSQ
jgi:hypothetical protein